MLKKVLVICCLVSVLVGCKTLGLGVSQETQTKTTQQLTLGGVGVDKDFMLQNNYNHVAIPSYNKPIKVSASVMAFNKQTYKAFTKAKALQSANISVKYIDSLENKPKYLKLQIVDNVALITALNNDENTPVKTYLSHKKDANILTSIYLALNTKDLEAITKADAVFLVEKGFKTYALQLYINSVKTETIAFNQGVVFGYAASNCCWQDNKRHQLDIVDLVTQFNSCPNKTYRSAKRAEKKVNTFNY
jgi:hypothetical protein